MRSLATNLLCLAAVAAALTTVRGCCSSAFINGFYRSDQYSDDQLHNLEEASCCPMTSPWSHLSFLVLHVDWHKILDSNNRWGYCPEVYFVNGFYRTGTSKDWLHHIEEGRCVKPADAPKVYNGCYNHDIGTCFDSKGWCKCNNDYFVTGVYRGDCDELHCMEYLRCCRPATSKETLDELFKVKTFVMEITLRNMALLAHYMGYGWCAGCRSQWVGDDFVRSENAWKADQSMRCDGYKNNQRLGLAFDDWSFKTKNIYYGQAVMEDLQPESVDQGVIVNNDANPVIKTVSRQEISVRTVTHKKTSSWQHSHELGVEVSYTPPDATGGVSGSVSYTFGYETGTTKEDSTGQQQTRTFTVSSTKEIAPFSSVSFQLVMSKTRNTLPYTAQILVGFSTEFQGFMRWGGGGNDPDTNYHEHYRGSDDRPTFNYRFGSSTVPFYTALNRESTEAQSPWLWHDLKNNHQSVQGLINYLVDENKYILALTGQFEDVISKQVELTWGPVTKRSVSEEAADDSGYKTITTVTQAGPDDPPAPNPDPPIVDVAVNNQTSSHADSVMEMASGGV